MPDKIHNDTFVINDIVLSIPPERINIQRQSLPRVMKALRTNSSVKTKSGQSMIDVSISVPFVGADEVNKKLRPLIAQFLLTPFCYVENKFLRDSIMGGKDDGQNMALALQAVNIMTVPGEPKTIQAEFSFAWFNYLPYTPNFYFKNIPFDPTSVQKEPGLAFKLFYAPKLAELGTVTLNNSRVRLEALEFLLTKNPDEFVGEIDLSEDNTLSDFEGKLSEYLDIADELEGFSPSDGNYTHSQLLDQIISLKTQLDPTDLDLTKSSINQIVRTISQVTNKYKSNKDSNLDKVIKQLEKKRDEILESGSHLFSGKVWLEWPSELSERNTSEEQPQLYYRVKELELGNSDLIVESMTLSYQHILATIPLASHQYPTCQYLGSSDIQVSIQVKCTSDEALQSLTNLWNTVQNNELNANFISQGYKSLFVENELVQMMGIEKMMWTGNSYHTIEGSPGTYDIQLDFIEAGAAPSDTESIVAIPRSSKALHKLIWKIIFNHISVDGPEKLRITGHLQEAERQLLERILNTDIWSGRVSAPFDSVGMREQLIHIWRYFKTGDVFPLLKLNGLTSSYYPKEGELSHTFRNILVVGSMTDDHVLGSEGLYRIFWNWGDYSVIRHSDKVTDVYKMGRSLAADRMKKDFNASMQSYAERMKKLQRVMGAIQAWEKAKDMGGNIKTKGYVVEVDGQDIDIREILKEVELDQELVNRVNDRSLALLRFDDELYPDLDFRIGMGATTKFINEHISELKAEYSRYIDRDIKKDPRELAAETMFFDWNEFAIRTADIILKKYLDFPIFREVKSLYDRMNFTPKSRVYRDFPLDEIKNNILVWASQQGDISPPRGWVTEPDFYFANETADGDISSIVPYEVIERVREETRLFANKVITENSTWYQEKYLQKVNPEFRRFLTNSQSSKVSAFPDTPMLGLNGLSQVNSKITPVSKSSNNQTVINKKKVGEGAEITLNVSGEIPKATRQLTHGNSPEAVLDGANSASPYDPITTNAYGLWVHPFPGSTITWLPGKRGEGFHRGTDFAFPGGDINNINKPVVAAASGRIVAIDYQENGAGNYIKIISNHPIYGELAHLYMHLEGFALGLVNGQEVKAGEVIGFCGATGINRSKIPGQKGAHLHFEIYPVNDYRTVYYPFFTYRKKEIDNTDPTGRGNRVECIDLINYGFQPSPILPSQSGISFGMSVLDKSVESLAKRWNQYGGYRMNRAYPGVYLSFIEEDAEDTIFRYDDFFSYNSIVDLQVSRSREIAADYAQITLTNISGLLSNRKFWGTHLEDKVVSNGKELRQDRSEILNIDTEDENPIDSFMLREGIKVELRLGYSDDPLNLEPVIVGRIVGFQFSDTDDLVVIEIQSLATELVQDIKGLNKAEKKSGWFVSSAKTGPILEEMISSPECVSFGMWKRGDQVGNAFRHILNTRWEWNPNPAADNIFAPDSSFLDPRTVFISNSFLMQSLEVVSGTTAVLTIASAGIHGGQHLASYLFNALGAENLARAAAPSSDNIGMFSSLSYYIYQMTIWDVFKEMELRHPSYIAHPVPYYERSGNARMTIFFGLPDQLYFARDAEWHDEVLLDEIESRSQELKKRLDTLQNTGEFKQHMRDILESVSTPEEDIKRILGNVKTNPITRDPTSPFAERPVMEYEVGSEAKKEVIERYKASQEKKLALSTGSIQPFRNYHLLTSRHHIISNTIRARSTSTANAVTIQYAEDGDEDVGYEKSNGQKVPTITDSALLTLKMDPLIPEEDTREAFHSYYNCQGEEMAKRYALSLLQKYAWQVYSGELVILGNPSIKPYDICYIFDEYSDMYGPIQVRDVQHYFSHDTGFITVITPDLIATISEGAELTQDQAMGLMAEAYLKRFFYVDSNLIEPGETPVEGASMTPFLFGLATLPVEFANIFGFKRIIFNTQFNWPIRIHPLIHHGKPIIAGFGPPHVMENEFTLDKAYNWIGKGLKGLAEKASDLSRKMSITPIDSRGRYTRGQFFGGGITSTTYRGN